MFGLTICVHRHRHIHTHVESDFCLCVFSFFFFLRERVAFLGVFVWVNKKKHRGGRNRFYSATEKRKKKPKKKRRGCSKKTEASAALSLLFATHLRTLVLSLSHRRFFTTQSHKRDKYQKMASTMAFSSSSFTVVVRTDQI